MMNGDGDILMRKIRKIRKMRKMKMMTDLEGESFSSSYRWTDLRLLRNAEHILDN